jgi:predicted AlkP superfamily pyrophosphatase or phosphodiesterase
VILGVAVLALACGSVRKDEPKDGDNVVLASAGTPTSPAQRDSIRAAHARTAHVIIVSIDGLRPDAIARFHATTLERLQREGRYALGARTIVPSTTIPSHASMLSGLGLLGHRVLWNDDARPHEPLSAPTVFSIAKRAELSTAAFFSKSKFTQLIPAAALDEEQAPTPARGLWAGDRTVGLASLYLSKASPNLLFVHLAEPDYAGHKYGWLSDSYGDAVRSADADLSRLLSRADTTFGAGRYTVIVTADHGGHGRTHGTARSDDVAIPWIAWGEGVERGAPLGEGIRTMDTAATALWLLGVDVPRSMSGRPVTKAFVK